MAKVLKAVNLPQLAHDIESVYSIGIINNEMYNVKRHARVSSRKKILGEK